MNAKNFEGCTALGKDKFATATVSWAEPHERHVTKEYEIHKNTRLKQRISGEVKTSRNDAISQALYTMGTGSTNTKDEGYWQITERPKEGKLIQSSTEECNPKEACIEKWSSQTCFTKKIDWAHKQSCSYWDPIQHLEEFNPDAGAIAAAENWAYVLTTCTRALSTINDSHEFEQNAKNGRPEN
jgi:hypothetical protein